MASSCLLPGCSAIGCQSNPITFFNEFSNPQLASAALQGSRGLDRVVYASKGSALCQSNRCNAVALRGRLATGGLATSSYVYGNGGLLSDARRQDFAICAIDDERLVGFGIVRPGIRAEQEAAPEEKPKRRRAAPRAKKTEAPKDTGDIPVTEAAPTPKKTSTRRRTTKAKADADATDTDSASEEPASKPRRTRTPRKKAAALEEAGPSMSDSEEEDAPGVEQPAAGKVRRRRKTTGSAKDAGREAKTRQGEESSSEDEVWSDEEGPENGASGLGGGNGAASRKNEVGVGRPRQEVVGELVSTKGVSRKGRRDSLTAETLPEDEELRVIAQKIVDGRARDLKLRPELDKLLDHYYLQECTKCYKVFVGRRPAPEQPYYGICRRPSDGNRWRSEVHEVVDSHVPSAITQPYPITHKLGKQTRYRYRVPAILAVCQMAGAIFPPTDNEFFDVIRRHDSRYEPFHIGALDLDQPPPPGGWRLEDAELLSEDTREKKLRMLRMRGHEFQDTYMPDDTGMTAETFADRSIAVDSQGDWNATSRRKDKYRP